MGYSLSEYHFVPELYKTPFKILRILFYVALTARLMAHTVCVNQCPQLKKTKQKHPYIHITQYTLAQLDRCRASAITINGFISIPCSKSQLTATAFSGTPLTSQQIDVLGFSTNIIQTNSDPRPQTFTFLFTEVGAEYLLPHDTLQLVGDGEP